MRLPQIGVLLTLVLVASGCGGKTHAKAAPPKLISTHEVVNIFEQVGFRDLTVDFNTADGSLHVCDVRSTRGSDACYRHPPASPSATISSDAISAPGGIKSMWAFCYATVAMANEGLQPLLARLPRARRQTLVSEGQFDIDRLSGAKVCNVVIMSHNDGREPALHARFEKAVAALRKECQGQEQ
jgi:hypothetical protein